jgi:UDP-N-acetyl-D-galactosamine dehydrogenase
MHPTVATTGAMPLTTREMTPDALGQKVVVVGLGYVGLPVAVAFGRRARCIGFDINAARVAELARGEDATLEVSAAELGAADILFTADPQDLKEADFHIVAVPTPIDNAKRPDLSPVLRASETVGRVLKRGDIVVFESTVYPGCTEEDCVPVLEKYSGLKFNKDFFCGYSPERIKSPEAQTMFKAQGFDAIGGTPDDFAKAQAAELEKWKTAVEAAGLRK